MFLSSVVYSLHVLFFKTISGYCLAHLRHNRNYWLYLGCINLNPRNLYVTIIIDKLLRTLLPSHTLIQTHSGQSRRINHMTSFCRFPLCPIYEFKMIRKRTFSNRAITRNTKIMLKHRNIVINLLFLLLCATVNAIIWSYFCCNFYFAVIVKFNLKITHAWTRYRKKRYKSQRMAVIRGGLSRVWPTIPVITMAL